LQYKEGTAGSLMGTEMVTVNENWSMPECLKEMRQQAEKLDEINYVYVIDDEERLQGVFPLMKIITSPSVSKVKHVMQKEPISVNVDAPVDEVAQVIEKYDLVAIPVIDTIGRLVGQITVDDVMDEIREHQERDFQLASGITQDVETNDSVFRQTSARLPWLLIGMLGGIGSSMILGNFDTIFASHPEYGLVHTPDRRHGWKRGYAVVCHRGAGTGQQLAQYQGCGQADTEGNGGVGHQCRHYLAAGVYLQFYSARPHLYHHLFGVDKLVCSHNVCLDVWCVCAYRVQENQHRSGHCHGPVRDGDKRYCRHHHLHGGDGLAGRLRGWVVNFDSRLGLIKKHKKIIGYQKKYLYL